jgi:predicted short-subunit dehydrogenase-like oxidoreductase (DUF2520 family)
MNRRKLNAIGCGRVGTTLARLWHVQDTLAVQDVLTTSVAGARRACEHIGAGTPVAAIAAMRRADIWMLAVPDGQLAATAQDLANAYAPDPGVPPPLAFHCSGALDSKPLDPLAALGWQVASAHCILSFASVQTALAQFAGTPCALEGQPHACAILHPVFGAIGAQCFGVASEDKLLYHAAAVFATNFLPVLQATAEDLWRATGVPAELLPALRTTLLRNAVDNIAARGPQGALTGPAARGDTAAIARQAQAVSAWDAQTGAAYEALSALALRLAKPPQP